MTKLLCTFLTAIVSVTSAQTWSELVVAPENRCSPYQARDYSYPQSVEPRIIAEIGKVYGPYTGRCFASRSETNIEHMVARSEAHDSGLCAADADTRRRFARNLLNLTLAAPRVNRYQKRDHDAAEWLPSENKCWFASRVVEVRRKYGLTIDQREADALDRVLSACSSTEMVVAECAPAPEPSPARGLEPSADPLKLYDNNGNGRITCAEARKHRIAPVPRGHPAYRYMRDADGIVCE